MLPPDAHARIAGELEDGERLIWEAQPIPSLYTRSAWPIAFFGLFFGGFAAFWIAAAGGMLWFSGGPRPDNSGISAIFNCFPLFGLPFLLIGIGMITSPIWMRRSAARVVYGVTNRRAIICRPRGFGGVEVRSLGPAELTNLTRIERADGAGDLVFQEVWADSCDSDNTRHRFRNRIGFIAISDVRNVEEIIRRELIEPFQQRQKDSPA
jgi:hypothetical protein